jgi:hypothetical protein
MAASSWPSGSRAVDGNRIELSGCRFPEVDFGLGADDPEGEEGIETIGAPAARYWIDLDTHTAGWEPIDDMIGEMCRVNDHAGSGQSSLVVLDARDIAGGPVARVLIPQRMPFGFHANWFPLAEHWRPRPNPCYSTGCRGRGNPPARHRRGDTGGSGSQTHRRSA